MSDALSVTMRTCEWFGAALSRCPQRDRMESLMASAARRPQPSGLGQKRPSYSHAHRVATAVAALEQRTSTHRDTLDRPSRGAGCEIAVATGQYRKADDIRSRLQPWGT
jgi:hypothetical protein